VHDFPPSKNYELSLAWKSLFVSHTDFPNSIDDLLQSSYEDQSLLYDLSSLPVLDFPDEPLSVPPPHHSFLDEAALSATLTDQPALY